ncbi:MAG: hypothetical protein E7257_00165 [Lachnospiraceae bacterium]|nr:hypothetical protein [Lachnospiraceae bacterium]MBQ9936267.1 hypothetical protein [Lachnospiraceae bacterium]
MAARTKMSREDRAKQFMPFAALKGFDEAIRKMEEECAKSNAGLMYDPDKIKRDEEEYDE